MKHLIKRSATTASALVLLAVAGCGGGGGDSGASGGDSGGDSGQQSAAAGTTLDVSDSDFGQILVDGDGMTLYMFEPDEGGKSTCEGDCLAAWPPVEGPAEAGQGVDSSLLGTTKAPDGTTMATYNDWPLYYWAKDQQPGDVTGQAVNDVWWVIGPDGEPIEQRPSASGDDAEAANTVETAKSDFGQILVDSEGMTLYMFDPDEQGKSVCDADCLEAWPVFEGPAAAGEGVDDSMLGTVKATDGSTMATFNDWPLYYFVKDQKPGDVNGQAANDVWWVMGPDGKPIRQKQ